LEEGEAMLICGIDPGTKESAYVVFDSERETITAKGILPNRDFLIFLRYPKPYDFDHLCCEMIAAMGMPVGKEVFETCLLIGRIQELWTRENLDRTFHLIYRREVKIHFCGSMKAKDGNIRQALIDRFGLPGTKKNPGKTFGISADLWQALAIAVFFWETKIKKIEFGG
jgi:hypothetical protein